MKKKLTTTRHGEFSNTKSLIVLFMKRVLIASIILFSISTSAFSQKITLNLGKVTLHKAFKKIKKEAKVDLFYSNKEINLNQLVTVNVKNEDVIKVISNLIGNKFDVKMTSEGIVLITPTHLSLNIAQETITIKGSVKNKIGETLPGVNILVKGKKLGTNSNIDGNYTIKTQKNDTLIFSYVGYKDLTVAIKGRTEINVVLEQKVNQIKEVVITGIVARDKKSFTGAVKSVKGAELKVVGNLNVVQSLKTLDPSFLVINNNIMGSNPNVLPKIEVRGQTSITTEGVANEFGGDPNQPLFVLDGFETSLRTIIDLDMNRVASITILKDAASTALYGAKAANGVVVVETVKPKPGKLRVSYTNDFRIEVPDLSGYNVMNSEEKLKFELLSGRWTAPHYDPNQQFVLNKRYNSILAEIRRGVDTYWLDAPTQVGTTSGHSLYVDGGTEDLTYSVGLNYRDQQGVMIGSSRKTWGGNIRINYRKDKLNISNNLYINGFRSDDSPYGNFSDYVEANPYYRKTDEFGEITKFLDTDTHLGYNVSNPLFNSTLNSYKTSNKTSIQNNLKAIYKISDYFRVQASLQLQQGITTGENFLDPENSSFVNTPLFEKGSYINSRVDNSSYHLNTMLSYSKIINNDHSLHINLRGEVEETKNKRLTNQAVGFPYGTNGNPAFSFSYKPDSKPSTAMSVYRRVNMLSSINYSYKRKYLFDATYRLDGSTTFGKNEKFSPFWAVGLGWNINNEFDMDSEKVSMLKLRGNIGSTGNQGFGSLASTSIYSFNKDINNFGQGTHLATLSNPDLKWQKTLNASFGLDGVFFNNRLSATLNVYSKHTDPLVVAVDLPSSTGVFNYPINTGNLVSNGQEVIIRYSPIYNLKNRITWTLGYTASLIKTKFDGFYNSLKSLNDAQLSSKTLQRYKDGYSPDDLWAVPSLGIDPATGKELFLTKDGKQTFDYDSDNEQVMGSIRPDIEGVISSNLRIRNFTFGLNLRYKIGGDSFNYALYNKVENISNADITLNQDRRALYDRWQNPGDVSKFKSISLTGYTPISSRFIQKENELIGESINIGFDFSNYNWLHATGLKTLRINAYMNDIFRISTIKAERGTSYPFSRAVSFSLNASF